MRSFKTILCQSRISVALCLLSISFCCCRGPEIVYPFTGTDIGVTTTGGAEGFYLLCEGNMGSNKASIDLINLRKGEYLRNLYPSRNPHTVKELGDVGNDLQRNGDRLYAVINCSHKVEIMDLSLRRIAQVNIPNCRNIAFADGKAFVTSYLGFVYVFDTQTLAFTDTLVTGLQPEQIVITNDKIYVANSGGYNQPDYDNTLSVFDRQTLQPLPKITVGINPQRLLLDDYNQLWITTLGNHTDIPAKLQMLDTKTGQLTTFDRAVSGFALHNDQLYCYATIWNEATQTNTVSYNCIDVVTHKWSENSFIFPDFIGEIATPYAIAVNDYTGDIYIADAKNYVSSGQLFCFSPDGHLLWKQWTGDIPAHFCFIDKIPDFIGDFEEPEDLSAYISKVYEYCPAPGQFVNLMPKYEDGDNAETMRQKAEKAIAGKANSLVTLGAWGGYITFGFDHAVQNIAGQRDFQILGNAFLAMDDQNYGSTEPGIVLVSQDENHNGLPDDTWYELKGSAGLDFPLSTVTYQYGDTIKWYKNPDESGSFAKNQYHSQPYYPLWDNRTERSFTGRILPIEKRKGATGITYKTFDFGYADNLPNNDIDGSSFDISWAMDSVGNSIQLDSIDFIRVYTAGFEISDGIGEMSTEIAGAIDLHKL